MLFMGLDISAKYQNIILIHKHISIQSIMKQLIHATLKSTWGIAKPKRHNVPLKMAIPAYKCRFFPVLLTYL